MVSQITTPITVDSLANLINSDLPITSVLTFAVDRLTPGFEDYSIAINALIALDHFGAITISVTEAEASLPKSKKPANKDGSAKSNETNPVLAIAKQPFHPYTGGDLTETKTQAEIIQDLWCRLVVVISRWNTDSCTRPVTIENISLAVNVRHPIHQGGAKEGVFFIKTRSAIGILRAATEVPAPLIAIVPKEKYSKIINYNWNYKERLGTCPNANYYTLLPDDENKMDHPDENIPVTNEVAYKIWNFDHLKSKIERCLYTIVNRFNPSDYDRSALLESRLQGLRRFVLIIESDDEIPNSYVSYFDGRKWYSIDRSDEISQKNFVLIGQFLTMQATVVTTPPPAPTISIGGSP